MCFNMALSLSIYIYMYILIYIYILPTPIHQPLSAQHPGSLWLLNFLVVWAGRGGGGAPLDGLGR